MEFGNWEKSVNISHSWPAKNGKRKGKGIEERGE
jgi:uncharacterized C2H2 Zn-finger protein